MLNFDVKELTFYYCRNTEMISLGREKGRFGLQFQRFWSMTGRSQCSWACGVAAHQGRRAWHSRNFRSGTHRRGRRSGFQVTPSEMCPWVQKLHSAPSLPGSTCPTAPLNTWPWSTLGDTAVNKAVHRLSNHHLVEVSSQICFYIIRIRGFCLFAFWSDGKYGNGTRWIWLIV